MTASILSRKIARIIFNNFLFNSRNISSLQL